MGMRIVYWSRSGEKPQMRGEYQSLDAVLAAADILSLHVPQEAGLLLDKAALAKMKKHAVLVNTAPASLVDPDALYEALKQNNLGAAAFDSFYTEGKEAWSCKEARLLSLGSDRFFITLHSGWRTKEADENMFRKALDYIQTL
jgi:glycerate dehydrogenase